MTYLKAVDATIQDSTAPVHIIKASNIIAETTIAVETAKDDYNVVVNSSVGFVVGQYLTIYNVAANRVYFSNILVINGPTITLDRPIDFEFIIGSSVTVGDTNMNVNGSVTPQIFGIRNPGITDVPLEVDITRLMFKCLTSSSTDLSMFGNIVGGLLRGVVIRRVDGTYQNILNVKTNGELKSIMFDYDAETVTQQGQNGFTSRLTFAGQNKFGAVVRIGPGEDLQVIIQDDLTSLTLFEIIAEGSEVVN